MNSLEQLIVTRFRNLKSILKDEISGHEKYIMRIIGKIALMLTVGIVLFIWNKYAIQVMIDNVGKKNP